MKVSMYSMLLHVYIYYNIIYTRLEINLGNLPVIVTGEKIKFSVHGGYF